MNMVLCCGKCIINAVQGVALIRSGILISFLLADWQSWWADFVGLEHIRISMACLSTFWDCFLGHPRWGGEGEKFGEFKKCSRRGVALTTKAPRSHTVCSTFCRDLKITTITNACCLLWLSLRSLVFLQIRLLETSEVLFQAPIEFRLKFLCTLAPLLFFDVAWKFINTVMFNILGTCLQISTAAATGWWWFSRRHKLDFIGNCGKIIRFGWGEHERGINF